MKRLVLVLCVALSGLWLINKNALFDGLEYTIDVFVNLQAARSVYVGDGFLHDYLAGWLKGLHNYFILVLLGPLALVWGAKAFFAVTAALQAGASVRMALSAQRETLLKTAAVIAAMLFGPVMFWMLDNPVYGWEPEVLFPFLSVLFADALLKRRWTVWIWGPLIIACREEGALLAGGIAAIALIYKRAPLPQVVRTYTVYLSIFGLSMLLLRLLRTPGTEDRMNTAFGGVLQLPHNNALLTDFLMSALGALAMFAAGLILLVAIGGIRLALPAVLVSLPLWAVTAIATLSYAEQVAGLQLHGFLWPPRFALMWAVLAAAGVFALANPEESEGRTVVICALLSLLLQIQILHYFRGYAATTRIAGLSRTVADELSPQTVTWARCLARNIPRQTVVEPHWNLQAIFEQQIIVGDSHRVPAKPDLFVCDAQRRLPLPGDACLGQLATSLKEGFVAARVNELLAAARPTLGPVLEMCTRGLQPAGR